MEDNASPPWTIIFFEELQQLRIPVSYDGLHYILNNLCVIVNDDKLNCINLVACVQFIFDIFNAGRQKSMIFIIHYHLQMRISNWWKRMYLSFPAVNQTIAPFFWLPPLFVSFFFCTLHLLEWLTSQIASFLFSVSQWSLLFFFFHQSSDCWTIVLKEIIVSFFAVA